MEPKGPFLKSIKKNKIYKPSKMKINPHLKKVNPD
jgi:hypothetical protein